MLSLHRPAIDAPSDEPLSEFQKIQHDLHRFNDEEIDEIWHRFDVDLSGELEPLELRTILGEVLADQGKTPPSLEDDAFDMVWSAFDTDHSGTVDKDEFRAYVKKYSLQKIPPFEISPAGAVPELNVVQEGAKFERKKSSDLARKKSLEQKKAFEALKRKNSKG